MGKYTRVFSHTVTRYLPIIALASSLLGVRLLCDIIVLFVVSLPFLLIAIASLTGEIPGRARAATIILYVEVLFLILVKYGVFSRG